MTAWKVNSLSLLVTLVLVVSPIKCMPNGEAADTNPIMYRARFNGSLTEEILTRWGFDQSSNKLYLGSLKVNEIEAGAFKKFEAAVEVDLSENAIKSIPVRLFQHMHQLKTLDLSVNYITHLNNDTLYISSPNELTTLRLSHNNLKDDAVKWDALLSLTKLKTLHLAGNKLNSISFIRQLVSPLNDFVMDSNSISSLQEQDCVELKRIGTVVMSYNQIPSYTCISHETVKIDLSGNPTLVLKPDVFENGTSLVEIVLNDLSTDVNVLRFQKLSKLTKLSLDKNTKLDSTLSGKNSFLQLPSLKSLSLKNNNIDRIESDAFKSMTSLEKLSLASNKLTEVQAGTFQPISASIVDLDLSLNEFESLNILTFEGMSSLKYLNLELNHLKTIDSHLFNPLGALQSLTIRSNKMAMLDTGVFSQLKQLKTLDLSANLLTRIGSKNVENLDSIIEISLEDNQIRRFDASAFMPLATLRILKIRGNPFTDPAATQTAIQSLTQSNPNLLYGIIN